MKFLKTVWTALTTPSGAAVISILSLLIGIYFSLQDKTPALTYEVRENASVFDLHTAVQKLKVSFNGVDLVDSKKVLRILEIRIVNSGSGAIAKSDFDDSEPFGLKLDHAKIIEIDSVAGSNAFIQRHVHAITTASGALSIAPIILQAGDYITARMLVMSDVGTIPAVLPTGRIANVKSVTVDTAPRKDSVPKWLPALPKSDNAIIQVILNGVYTLIFGAIALLIGSTAPLLAVIPIMVAYTLGMQLLRKRRINHYLAGADLTAIDKRVLRAYRNRGKAGLTRLEQFLETIERRQDLRVALAEKFPHDTVQKVLTAAAPLGEREDNNLVVAEKDLIEAIQDDPAHFEKLRNSITRVRRDLKLTPASI